LRFVVATMLFTLVQAASAQAPVQGDTVRVSVRSGLRVRRFSGELVGPGRDTIQTVGPNGLTTVAYNTMLRFEVLRGTRTHMIGGAGFGFAAGVLLGIRLHPGEPEHGSLCIFEQCPRLDAAVGGIDSSAQRFMKILGDGLLGALGGGLTGSAIHTRRWVEIPR
jgi:hypothetical protein